MYIEELISKASAEKIVALFNQDKRKQTGRVRDEYGESAINEDNISTELYFPRDGEWEALYQELDANVREALKQYIASTPALQIAPVG